MVFVEHGLSRGAYYTLKVTTLLKLLHTLVEATALLLHWVNIAARLYKTYFNLNMLISITSRQWGRGTVIGFD